MEAVDCSRPSVWQLNATAQACDWTLTLRLCRAIERKLKFPLAARRNEKYLEIAMSASLPAGFRTVAACMCESVLSRSQPTLHVQRRIDFGAQESGRVWRRMLPVSMLSAEVPTSGVTRAGGDKASWRPSATRRASDRSRTHTSCWTAGLEMRRDEDRYTAQNL